VPSAHVYLKESTKDCKDLVSDDACHLKVQHAETGCLGKQQQHNCSLFSAHHYGLDNAESVQLRYASSLRVVRGGKDGSPKLLGLKLPSGLGWAFGLGLNFKGANRKLTTIEKKQHPLLNDSTKAIMLQGFDWSLMPDKPRLYANLVKEMPTLHDAGVNVVWFPPPSSSADPHGYMPGKWYEIPFKEQLLDAVGTARAYGILSMVDVVLNHRSATKLSNTTGDWTSFEAPDWEEWAVVRNDWKCAPDEKHAFCPANCTCGAADTGENACFAPDVDHTNPQVQADVEAWLRWLREALGFDAFRFDNTKGFSPEAVARYVAATRPAMSVGEYFDTNRDLLTAWLRRAGGGVAAFDFGLRYKLKDSVKADDYSPLRDAFFGPMLHYAASSAVTFLDNHDTAGELKDRFGEAAALEQGYAFLLTHPGVPCIFWADWVGPARDVIRTLAGLRARAGVTSVSEWDLRQAGPGLYAAVIGGDALAVKLGSGAWSPNQGLPERRWQGAASGPGWAVWTRIPKDPPVPAAA
jgi:alpha-amylase